MMKPNNTTKYRPIAMVHDFNFIPCCFPQDIPLPTPKERLERLKALLNPEGVIVVGDVSFPDREGLEAVREAYEDDWDDSEFYLVREELEAALPMFDVDCIPISFCADVLILSPAD